MSQEEDILKVGSEGGGSASAVTSVGSTKEDGSRG